jgi:DNA-binding transcriptional regulator YdaS (Cro superfamily)
MRLATWVAQQGRGELTRLRRVTGLSYPTVHAVYSGTQTPTYETAVKISRATGGVVTVAELCEPAESPPAPRRNAKRSRRRTRPKAAAA